MKEKNFNQVIRFDGKNVFFEVMNAFKIGKVQVNFIQYDNNNKQIRNIKLYMDIPKFLVLANDIISGKMSIHAKTAKETQVKGDYKYCKEIFTDLGGISADKLAKKTPPASRPDGKSISRQFKITPANSVNFPWLFSGEQGAGEENATGLIVPQGIPEEIVRVPLSDDDFKKFALVVRMHIEGFITAQYMMEATNPTTPSYKPKATN